MFKLKIALLTVITLTATSAAYSENMEDVKAKIFFDRLAAYQEQHEENQKILLNNAKYQTEAEKRLWFWTICSGMKNLQRAQNLIEENPQFAQYLDGTYIPSLESNLDFQEILIKSIEGTEYECSSKY